MSGIDSRASGPEVPPGTWPAARTWMRAAFEPIERFLRIEASSGVLLLLSAAVALGWANSPWSESYRGLLQTPVELRIGGFSFAHDLHFVVNEVLMTLFFLLVGLEIRREIHHGELSELRRAALPIAGALGGMLAPAVIYTALNAGTAGASGWGVPMATDIAFAVGVLALLGSRVPAALRVLLLTLAIADDIGAVLAIALFYSSGVQLEGLLGAAGGIVLVFLLQKLGVRRVAAYFVPGAIVWEGFHAAGVHPTLAGVVVGLLTPATTWLGPHGMVQVGRRAIERVERLARREVDGRAEPDPHDLKEPLRQIQFARREALSPVERITLALHPWVAFGVMPVFALANAGVPIDLRGLSGDGLRIAMGVMLGLVLGKPIGVLTASALVVKLGIAPLPRGVTWSGIALVGTVAGIGFTMAIFIADLAFVEPFLSTAKLAILSASVLAAAFALALGVTALRVRQPAPGQAQSAGEAERSTVA